MRIRRSLWIVSFIFLTLGVMASAQDTSKEPVKRVPIKPTSAASGQDMYKSYCAACHGVDGKGNGPASDALKVPATNLATLAQKNGGKYPALKVAAVIHGDDQMAAHGSKDMPIWGSLFWGLSGGHDAEVQQRIVNLNKYIESLQIK